MLRISKMTDYATVLLAALARDEAARLSAGELATRTHIAAPTVAKVLKLLQRGGLVRSTRGRGRAARVSRCRRGCGRGSRA